jgi:hypothetical protein
MPAKKTHLHASSLTLNGLTPGRTIVWVNRELGILGVYVILEYPKLSLSAPDMFGPELLRVKLRNVATGQIKRPVLADMGVIPYRTGHFSDVSFVIDRRKIHLLNSWYLRTARNALSRRRYTFSIL